MSDMENSLGVVKTGMSSFYNEVRARLMLITGLAPMSRKLQMMDEDRRMEALLKPILAIGDPGIGKTSGVIQIIKEMRDMMSKQGRKERIGFKKIQLGQTQVGELNGIPMFWACKNEPSSSRRVRKMSYPPIDPSPSLA